MAFSMENFMDCLRYGFIYLPVTAKLSLISFLIGIAGGMIIAMVRNYKVPVLSQFFAFFVAVYQGIPVAVALLIYSLLFTSTFNDFAAFFHLGITMADVDSIIVGYFTLSLFCITTISETFRGALMSVPRIQYEAGYSVGLTKLQTLFKIVLPQMLPVAMPGLTNNMVGTIKATALVSAVGIVEVMAGAVIPCGVTYSFIEGYAAAAVVYWLFSILLSFLLRRIEKHCGRYRREVV